MELLHNIWSEIGEISLYLHNLSITTNFLAAILVLTIGLAFLGIAAFSFSMEWFATLLDANK